MTDYRWQVELWDPAAATWTLDGNESLATGIAPRFDGTAEDLADRLLRNWTYEPSTADGRWRATVWAYDPSRPRGEPAATREITRPAGPEAGPYTVTEYFVTNIGPTLHYTLTSPVGHVLDYWRDPDGNVGAQIKVGSRWSELNERGPRYQAVIEGVRAHEARHPDLAGYNNPQAASAARPDESHGIAKVPDLSKLPAEPKVPDRESVDDWSLQSMTDYLDALKARDAYHHASRAAELQQSGGSHQDIMRALAGAEMAAPEKDRSFHAGRLDQYASAHGLRGWYRHQTSSGEHLVQVNKLRTPADGDKGRYFASDPFGKGRPRVVDRDTGKFVTPAVDPKAARDWIRNAESPKPGPPAGSTRPAASRTTTPAARTAMQPPRRSRGR